MDWLLGHWWQVALVGFAWLIWRAVAGIRADLQANFIGLIRMADYVESNYLKRPKRNEDRAA